MAPTQWQAFMSLTHSDASSQSAARWLVECDVALRTLFASRNHPLQPLAGILHDPFAGVIDGPLGEELRVEASFKPDTYISYEYRTEGHRSRGLVTAVVSADGTTLDLQCDVAGNVGPSETSEVGAMLASLSLDFAQRNVVDFGNVSCDNWTSRTSLEVALGRDLNTSRREARRLLRGYSWITIGPPGLLNSHQDRLRRASLERVLVFDNGCVGIQASERCVQYNRDAAYAVFLAVAPVLPRGLPRAIKKLPGDPDQYVIIRDAAEVV